MASVVTRLRDAMNARDAEALRGCFDPGYHGELPAHPGREVDGTEQVHANWLRMFEKYPDFEAELVREAADGETAWAEWRWRATGLEMRGVTLMGVREGRIAWARLYVEPVEGAAQG